MIYSKIYLEDNAHPRMMSIGTMSITCRSHKVFVRIFMVQE